MYNSLRLRLALWLLLPLSAFVAICGYLSWRHAAEAADYVQDHDLLSSAKVLADRLIWEDGDIHASVPPAALSLFMSPAHDQVFLSVTDMQGNLLAGTPQLLLPAPALLPASEQAQWYDTQLDTMKLRAVVLTRSMFDVAGAREIHIVVGKTTRSHAQMIQTLWRPTMQYLLIALALVIVLSAAALTLELRPLLRLSERLAQRDPLQMDLYVDRRRLHTELRPLADTLNQFMQQIQLHTTRQRQFIADAAHQLRTPLAMQASAIETARHSSAAPTDARSTALLTQLRRSNQRLVNVTNQLLLLAQAEHRDARTHLASVDLAEVALHCVEQLLPLAEQRQIDLGLDIEAVDQAGKPQFWALVPPALISELVSNLVDNALRYTPAQGWVTVKLQQQADKVILTVEDNGPGIAPEAHARVFERFYRIDSYSQGSGLGLAIVQEIARASQAQITLSKTTSAHSGLSVAVSFNAATAS